MTMTLTKLKSRQAGGIRTEFIQVTNSANYATAGEAVDFAAAAGMLRKPDLVVIVGNAGYIYQWDKANNKVKVLGSAATAGAALAEFTSGAFSAALTADTVIARAEWVATPNNG